MTEDLKMSMSVPDGNGGTIETGLFTLDDLKTALDRVKQGPEVIKAAAVCIRHGGGSTSLVQRKLSIGYNRAARHIEALEEFGVLSKADHVGKRTVIASEGLKQAIFAREEELQVEGAKSGATTATAPPTTTEDEKSENYRVTAGELRQFVERYERLEEEKKAIAEQQKELMAEAKGRGYDVKVLRQVIALRKRDENDIAEEEAVLEMYKEALGMT